MIFDTHIHTIKGSTCSTLDPEELFKKAKEIGIHGLCITEHDWSWDGQEIIELSSKHQLVIIKGMEVSTNRGHVLVYGLPQYIEGMHNINKLAELVRKYNGAMIAAHPFRNEFSPLYNDVQKKCPADIRNFLHDNSLFKLVDGIEVFNGTSTLLEIKLAHKACRLLSLKGTGGSDAHSIHTIGTCVTIFDGPITSEKEYITALKKGSYTAVDYRNGNTGNNI